MINIKTHNYKSAVYKQPHFFILNKGNNSGKPMFTPCPNCFVCICESEEEQNRLYWLFFGLWKGLFFYPHLIGSVIPFIRIAEIKQILRDAILKVELKTQQFNKNLETLHLLNEKEKAIEEQIKLIKQLKIRLMRQVLK